MKIIRFFCMAACLLFFEGSPALTIYTANHLDWDSPYAWLGGQVPGNADTVVIRHYITFSHSLTIAGPTVLLIDSSGTLCGNYLLDVACGAKLINNGNVYVNSAKIRDGQNHGNFYAKNQIVITGCAPSGYGTGFINSGPNANTYVWPPVLCKTPGTNWEGGTINGFAELAPPTGFSALPNPVQQGRLTVSANSPLQITLSDASGRTLLNLGTTMEAVIDMSTYASGLYFLRVSDGSTHITRKVINP